MPSVSKPIDAQLNPYEVARAEVMKRNLEKMKELGLDRAAEALGEA
jgi:hypothetical protein